MELREYSAIFRKQAKLFWSVVILFVVIAFVWQKNQGINYQATLLLNIGRAGIQNTQDYTYDSFYRLQADERFADTVVRWLGSPRVVTDIYKEAQLDVEKLSLRELKSVFKAGRLSSQVIEVTYVGQSDKKLNNIARSVTAVLNRYIDSLNKEKSEPNHFIVIGSDPIIRDNRIGLLTAFAIGLAAGIFIGFWAGLLRHYFQPAKNN